MAQSLGLNDSFSEDGYWWLPTTPDKQVAGTLTFSPDKGSKLALLGILSNIEKTFGARSAEICTIHGVTRQGKKVTLLNALSVSQQINAPGIISETYRNGFTAIGFHFLDSNEELFETCYHRFANLERWIGSDPFKPDYNGLDKDFLLTISRSRNDPITNFDDIEITSGADLHTSQPTDTAYRVDVVSSISVKSSAAKSLDWHFEVATKIQQLASLCTGHYLPLTSLRLKAPKDERGGHSAPIDVYVQMTSPESGARPKHEQPLISAKELISSDPSSIKKWFEQYEKIEPVINLFYAVTGEQSMFVNVRFLLAIQALEAYHRRTDNTTIIEQREYEALKRLLISHIPQEADKAIREKLTSTLQYSNEPSLNQRLKSILASMASSFGSIPPGFSGNFVRSLIDTRNYNTHFSEALEKKSLDAAGMHWASRRIILLMTVLLLLQIGIEPAKIEEVLDRHQEFSRLWRVAGHPF